MAKSEAKKSRFNAFDALIIFLIVACIAAIAARYYFTSEDSLGEKVTVDFIVPGVMDSTAQKMTDTLKSGTTLYLTDGGKIIGYISSVSSSRSQEYAENESGDLIRVDNPISMDVKGVAVLYGTTGKDGFLIGGKNLATVSGQVYVYTTDIEFAMTLNNISASEPK